ncbi:MAG: hypothetical protein H0X34_16725 [Chthoniobacterales bacterium]|nr:hypothetical protein [Chthoniobacterales bacterium]
MADLVLVRPAQPLPNHQASITGFHPVFTFMNKQCSVEDAVKAQKALRAAAGLGAEEFPIQAFVGMISDEIESLRKQGKSDEDIAALVRENSPIKISAAEIATNYAPPEERKQHAE